jgi:anaerobic selenocysteine-containing dehydrogenase
LNWESINLPKELASKKTRSINMIELGKALTSKDLNPRVDALFVFNSNPAVTTPNQNLILKKEGKPYLEVNPNDASSRNIADGDELTVYNQRGSVFRTARISNKVQRGIVCMPQGFWPSLLKGGSSANALTDHLLTDMGRGGAIQEAKVEIVKV